MNYFSRETREAERREYEGALALVVTITGPSPSIWTTSMPYRVAVDPRSDPDRHAYFSLESHARAYLDRNAHLPREIELSPRMALGGGGEHVADEPWTESTPGQVAAAEGAF